jgi:hypothetical protein
MTRKSRRPELGELHLQLPHVLEAERVIIGSLLLGNCCTQILAKLAPEDFFDSRLRVIYSRLYAMHEDNKTLDLPTAVDELRANSELDAVGDAAFVSSLIDGLPHRLSLDSYANAILEAAMRRKTAYLGQEILEMAVTCTSAREVLLTARKKVLDLQTSRLGGKTQGFESAAELLDKCSRFVRRFVAMSPTQSDVVALWIFHTHAIDATDVTGYLSVTSAEKRCGKTRLLEVCELLVANAWLTGRVTSAVLPRKIEAVRPTLLLDESDTALRDNSEYSDTLRGVLNLGYRRGGVVSCCVGRSEALNFHDFSAFCPKAIAGIGSLPDTVADRSFPIRLQRRASHESLEAWRRNDIETEASSLRDQIEACASKMLETLRASRPAPLQGCGDRQNEIAEPLLAIADSADGDWPSRARIALLQIFLECSVREESLGIRLLENLRVIFEENSCQQIQTTTLLEHLISDDGAPWCEFSHGRPLTARGLARLLAPFGIRPIHSREGAKTTRGYSRCSFVDAWERYCTFPAKRRGAGDTGTNGTNGTSDPYRNMVAADEYAMAAEFEGDKASSTSNLPEKHCVPDVSDVPVARTQHRDGSGLR